MQLLFAESDEAPGVGLDLIPGRVTRLRATRVPHIGWNTLGDSREPLLERAPLPAAYFANGFACRPCAPECATAWTTHETDRFPAVVRAYRTIGFQFHPEKSSRAGVRLLHAALEECRQ
jgi:glutamine amidotransferase